MDPRAIVHTATEFTLMYCSLPPLTVIATKLETIGFSFRFSKCVKQKLVKIKSIIDRIKIGIIY